MNDLNFPVTSQNLGGVRQFWFTALANVTGIDYLTGELLLKNGAYWSLGRATRFTLKYSCPAEEKRGGTIHKPILTGVSSKWTDDMEQQLDEMRAIRWFVLLIEDLNGNIIQVGGLRQGLSIATNMNTGDLPSAKNGVTFTLKGDLTTRPQLYSREIVVADSVQPTSDWLLATGIWNDAGFWRDDAVWVDTPQ